MVKRFVDFVVGERFREHQRRDMHFPESWRRPSEEVLGLFLLFLGIRPLYLHGLLVVGSLDLS